MHMVESCILPTFYLVARSSSESASTTKVSNPSAGTRSTVGCTGAGNEGAPFY